MLLAIDCGNTNTVFAVFDGDDLKGTWRATTVAQRTPDEYAVWLSLLMQLKHLAFDDITGVIIANVVPLARFGLVSFAQRYMDCDALVVGDAQVKLGMKVKIAQPETAGADRLVNAVAAHKQFGGPLIAIDFGTATTFDLIDANGDYIGGVLAPGVHSAGEALFRVGAQLPRVEIKKPAAVIGQGTVSAMQSGIYWGYVGLIEGTVARIKAEFGAPMKVIATGGLAALFTNELDCIDEAVPDLTMRGLVEIYRRNAE